MEKIGSKQRQPGKRWQGHLCTKLTAVYKGRKQARVVWSYRRASAENLTAGCGRKKVRHSLLCVVHRYKTIGWKKNNNHLFFFAPCY